MHGARRIALFRALRLGHDAEERAGDDPGGLSIADLFIEPLPEAIARGKYGVCLEYHIGNCKGPCVGRQSEEEYRHDIDLIVSMLSGDMRTTRNFLEKQMHAEARKMNSNWLPAIRHVSSYWRITKANRSS